MLVRGIEQRLLPSVTHIADFILSCPLCTESDKAQCLMGHLVGMQKDAIDAMGCASVAFAARNSSLVSGRYTGEKLLDERVPVLLEAGWRPAPQGAFPDLPQSPRSNGSTDPPRHLLCRRERQATSRPTYEAQVSAAPCGSAS